jgi:hypothetical protein
MGIRMMLHVSLLDSMPINDDNNGDGDDDDCDTASRLRLFFFIK